MASILIISTDIDEFEKQIVVTPMHPNFLEDSLQRETEAVSSFSLLKGHEDVDMDINTICTPLLGFNDPAPPPWEGSAVNPGEPLNHEQAAFDDSMMTISHTQQSTPFPHNYSTSSGDRMTKFLQQWIRLERMSVCRDEVALESMKVQQKREEIKAQHDI